MLEIRIITNDAPGAAGDAMVGIDDIVVSSTDINDSPIITGLDTGNDNAAWTEDFSGAVILDAGGALAAVTDADSANFAGGTLTVSVSTGDVPAEDVLSLADQPHSIELIGGNVVHNDVVIGTWTGGTNGDPLVFTFNAASTPLGITALLRNLTYHNSNVDNPNTSPREIEYVLTDGDGGSATAHSTVSLTAADDLSEIGNLDGDSVDWQAGDAPVLLDEDGNATVTDVDTASFDDYILNVQSISSSDDLIGIASIGGVSLSGSNILVDGEDIGDVILDGTGGHLQIQFDEDATADGIQRLLRAITVTNTAASPTLGAHIIDILFYDPINLAGPNVTATFNVVGGSLSVGNLVFLDANNNGVFDAGDSGIDGIAVQLVDASNGSYLATTVTAGGGLYSFTGLAAGDYYLLIDGSEVPPGLVASPIVAFADDDVDNDNNGVNGAIIGTTTFTLTAGGEPTGEDGDADTNFTIDFGFTYGAPTLDLDASSGGTGYTTSYTEGGFGVTIADSDADIVSSGPVTSITITLTDHEAGDQLFVSGSWSNDDIVTSAYDSNTGILTLYIPFGGSASAADFEQALRAISYRNTGINPTDDGANPDRAITFTVNSAAGASNTATTTINITPVNSAAVIGGEDAGDVTEDFATTSSGMLTISDPDGPDIFTPISNVLYTYGRFTLAANGAWSYELDHDAANSIPSGENRSEIVTVSAADGTTHQVTIAIHGTNDAAIITGTDTGAVTEDNGTAATGALGVSDVDDGEAAFVVQNSVATAHGFFSIDGFGNWSFTLNDSADDHIPDGEEVIETITVSSIDGTTHDISITITGVNDTATIGGDHFGLLTEDTTLGDSGTLTVDDPDDGEAFFVAQVLTTSAYGSFTLTADGGWTYSLNNSAVQFIGGSGSITDSFTATTEGGATQTVTMTIYGVNDDATFGGTNSGSVTEDGTTTASGALTVSDADFGEDSFAVQSSAPTAYGTFSIDALGNWTYQLNNGHPDVQGLNDGQMLQDVISVESLDGTDHSITITIHGADEAPTTGPVVDLDGVAGGFDYTGSYTEGDLPGAAIGSAINVTEGTLPIVSATITLTDPGGEGSLHVGTLPLTITNVSTNDLVVQLVGVGASAADWEAALAAITFASSSDNPDSYGTDTFHTITVTLSDGVTPGNTATATINIIAISDDPVVADANEDVTWTEGQAYVLLDRDSDALVSDVDNLNFDGGQLGYQILTGATADDRLIVATVGNVTLSGNDVLVSGVTIGTIVSNGVGSNALVIDLNAAATVARVQELVRAIAYTNVSDNPTGSSRPIVGVLEDGDGGSVGYGMNVNIVPVDDPAVINVPANDVTYIEQGPGVLLDTALTVTDPDGPATIEGATVTISSGFVQGEDILTFDVGLATSLGIGVIYDHLTGVLTLENSASLGDYEQLLRTVRYANTGGDNPTAGDRVIDFAVDNGPLTMTRPFMGLSIPVTNAAPPVPLPGDHSVTVHVEAVNDAPTVTINIPPGPPPAPVTNFGVATSNIGYFGDQPRGYYGQIFKAEGSVLTSLSFKIDGVAGTSDYTVIVASTTLSGGFHPVSILFESSLQTVAADADSVHTTVTINTGALALTPGASYVFLLNANAGTLPQGGSGTATLAHNGASNAYPDGSFVFLHSNSGSTATDFASNGWAYGPGSNGDLAFSFTYGAPPAASFSATEQVALDLKGTVSVDDVDAGAGTITVTISVDYGVIDATSGLTGVTLLGGGTGTLIVEGTLAQVQAFLATSSASTLTYTANTDTPPASATLSVNINDNGNTGNDPGLTGDDDNEQATATATIAITAVNDRPALADFSSSVTFLENIVNATPQLLDSDVTFTDPENNFNGGTLNLSGGLAEDLLGIRNQGTGAGQIGVSGANITYGGVVIGTFVGGSAVSVTFNAAATSAAIDALIQNLTYANNSDTPTPSRTLLINVTDADGAELLLNGQTITVNVTPESDNTPPTVGANAGLTLDEGATETITAAMLDFNDAQQADGAITYTITTAATNGTLRLGATALGVGDSFTQADVNAGLVTYEHDGGETTSASFGFSVSDGIDTVPGQSFAITVDPVNDAPTLDDFGPSVTFLENTVNAAPQLLDFDVTFNDPENNFNGGQLTVTGMLAEDFIGVRDQGMGAGEIGVSGIALMYEGVVIGTISDAVGLFSVDFNSNATSEAIEALIQNLTYSNNSDTPTASRTLTLNVTDADGDAIAGDGTFGAYPGDPFDAAFFDYMAPAPFDFDNDGDLDVVFGQDGGPLRLYRNNGAGLDFTEVTSGNPFAAFSFQRTSKPAFVDLDNDGDLDLVVGDQSGLLRAFRNGTTGTAGSFTELLGAPNPFNGISVGTNHYSAPAFIDLDGDGDRDLLLGERHADTLRAFLNNGPGLAFSELSGGANPFNSLSVRPAGSFHTALGTIDLDGDGDLDLVVGNSFGTLLAFRNNGAGQAFTELTGAANPFDGIDVQNYSAPGFVDLDGDGDLDAIVGSAFDGVTVFANNLAGQSITVNVTPESDNSPPTVGANTGLTLDEGATETITAAMLDYNDAEQADGAITYTITIAATNGTLRLGATVLGVGGTFTQADLNAGLVTYEHDGGETTSAAFGFSVSDGIEAVTGQSFAITVDPVNDAPTLTDFGPSVTFLENTVNAAPQLLDFDVTFDDAEENFDGGTLTLTGGLPEDVLGIRNQGIALGEIGVSGANVTYGGVVIGSFAGGGSSLTVTFNAAATAEAVDALIQNLTYANADDTPTASRTLTLNVTDSDGADLTLPGPMTLAPLTGPANPFSGVVTGRYARPAFADLDGDGDLDAVIGHRDGIQVFRNGTDGTSGAFTEQTGGANPLSGFSGFTPFTRNFPNFIDLDADGDLDLVVGTGFGSIRAFRNTAAPGADAAFTELTGGANPFNGITGSKPSPAFIDLDGDGDLDAVVGVQDGTFRAFENTAGPGAPVVFTELTGSNNPFNGLDSGDYGTPSFADLDGDGDLDMVSGDNAAVLKAFRNNGDGTFTEVFGGDNPFTPYNNTYGVFHQRAAAAFVDIDGDGDIDALVGSLNYAVAVFQNNAPQGQQIVVNVTAENDAPTVGANTGLTLYEGATQTITAAMLDYNDPEQADGAITYTITSAATNGTLRVGATVLGVGGTFTQADLNAGLVTYQHNGGETTSASFGFSVSDGIATVSGQSFAITVNPVNDAPTLANLQGNSVSYTEQAAPRLLDALTNATVGDVDSANFATGTLRVAITAGGVPAEDQLSVVANASVTVGAGTVSVDGTQIATFTGGSGGADLVFTFNSFATPAAVQALVRAIGYANGGGDLPTAGVRTITWTLNDGDGILNGGADTVTVTSSVTVVAVDDPPAGIDGSVAIDEDEHYPFASADFGFTDPEGNPANAVRIETLPTNGIIYYDADGNGPGGAFAINEGFVATFADLDAGRLYYVPDADQNGDDFDSFTFAMGGSGGFDESPNTLTIDVAPVNDPAVITGDAAGDVTEAGGVGNATPGDPDDSGDLNSTDIDSPADTWAVVAPGAASGNGYGTYALTAAGVWTYTLNDNHPSVQALNGLLVLTDTFTVFTSDGTAQIVTVTIHGQNDAAAITGDAAGDVTEAGGVGNGTPGTATDSGDLGSTDIDNTADAWQVVSSGASTNGYGTYSLSATGVWVYTLNNNHALVQALNGAATLTDSFNALTVDGTIQLVTVTIHAQNDNAVISGDAFGHVTEAGGVGNGTPGTATDSGDLNATDVDNTADAWQAVSAGAATVSGYGTYALTAAGVWTYTLNDNHPSVQALNGAATLTDTFTVLTADGTSQLVSVTIHAQNDSATITGDFFGDVTEAGGVANGTPGDPDDSGNMDSGDLDNTADAWQAVSAGAATTNGYGTYALSASGVWTYTLNDNHAAVQALNGSATLTDNFTVFTVDGTSQMVTVTIHAQNDAAVISGDASGDVTEAGGLNNGTPGVATDSGNLGSTDVDNAADTWQAVAAGAATLGGYGTYALTAAGVWTYTLNDNHAAVQALNGAAFLVDTFTAVTGDGTSTTVSVTIHAQNDLGVAQDDAFATDEATPLVGNVFPNNGSGPDSDIDNPLVVTHVNGVSASVGLQIALASGATLTLNADGSFTYNPNHVFDSLPTALSGASNTQAPDSFTYTLTGGETATVHIIINGLDSDDYALGTAGADNINAGAGSDVIDGLTGADTLNGGAGNDFIYVDEDDIVIDSAGNGFDNVLARTRYVLGAGQHIELLSTSNHGGTAQINLTGNELANVIIGNAGTNVLDGGGGADRLQGLGGDDFIFVDSMDDYVDEVAGGGFDNVMARVTYILTAGAHVELLSTDNHGGVAQINLTGNELANIVVGNAGTNVLEGGAGAIDHLAGLGGNDFIFVKTGDIIEEAINGGYDNVMARSSYVLNAGAEIEVLSTADHGGIQAINLTGNEFANILVGNAGTNILDGGRGHDLLDGFGGVDKFAFTTALGVDNVDTILNFDGGDGADEILLENAIFTGLVAGVLDPNAFHVGTAATTADHRIIYDNITGKLWFDADGSGSGAAVQFALLDGAPVLASSDFTVI